MKHSIRILAILLALLLTGCVANPATQPVTTAEPPVTTETVTDEPETQLVTTEPSSEPQTVPSTEPSTGGTDETTAAKETTTMATKKTTTATVTTTANWKKDYHSRQILGDPAFHNGLIIDTPAVQNNRFVPEGVWKFMDTKEEPVWDVNQSGNWRSYNVRDKFVSLLADNVSTSKNALRNYLCGLAYDPKEDSMTFHWDSTTWYDNDGEGHDPSVGWPGMILQQVFLDKAGYIALDDEDQQYYRCDADKIIVSMDIRMTSYSHNPLPGVNACQFLSYYYIKSTRDNGFIWFGVPLFDDRWCSVSAYYDETEYFAIDPGSGAFVYCMPCKKVFDCMLETGKQDFFDADLTAPEPSSEWLHLEMDIRPWIDRMAELTLKGSQNNTFYNTKSIKDLYIEGMNIGYEVHGEYTADFEIKNYAITSYVKK